MMPRSRRQSFGRGNSQEVSLVVSILLLRFVVQFQSFDSFNISNMFEDEDDDVIIASAAFVVIASKVSRKKRREPRFWIRPSLLSRNRYSARDLFVDLVKDDADILNFEYRCNGGFRNFFRMTPSEFENLLQLVGGRITKIDTQLRQCISAQDRLAVTLRFLITGDSYHSLMYLFKISKSVISRAVIEVCTALIDELHSYIQVSFFDVYLKKMY